MDQDDCFLTRLTTPMSPEGDCNDDGWQMYCGDLVPGEVGRFDFTVRILPDQNHLLLDPHYLGLIFLAKN